MGTYGKRRGFTLTVAVVQGDVHHHQSDSVKTALNLVASTWKAFACHWSNRQVNNVAD